MPQPVRTSRNFLWIGLMTCICLVELTGCAPMVMLGKMLQGDPLVDDEFEKWNGKSLAKSDKQVAILCSTPESIKSEYASLDIDLLSEISRKLAAHDVSVIKPHKVATWIDDHGLDDLDMKELGEDLDADYVIQVKLDHFDYREQNSPNLFRGRTGGTVTAYELIREEEPLLKPKKSKADDSKKESKKDSEKSSTKSKKTASKDSKDSVKRGKIITVKRVYNRTFQNVYPTLQPVSIEQMQPEIFKKKFVDHVSNDLSRLFYPHKAGVGF